MSAMLGTLYGLGVGPGAPDLLTLRAARLLRSCPVICVPTSEDGHSYAWPIVEGLIDRARQEVIFARFVMRPEGDDAVKRAREVAHEVVLERLERGQDVAFVTEGDPMLYSTFGRVAQLVRERRPELAVAVVPGVTSVTAAAAAARVPLGQGRERIAILPAVYELESTGAAGLASVLRMFDTVVLLKVGAALPRVLDLLDDLGLAEHTLYARRAGTQAEEVVTDLAALRDQPTDYFSLLIVRNLYAARDE